MTCHSHVHRSAEDTAVYLAVLEQEDSDALRNDINKLEDWQKAWDMEFNQSKCQVLHTSRSFKSIKYAYTMHGQVLDSVDQARYLGVAISSDLNFDTHINRVTANASKYLGFLKRNTKIKHPGICEAAYKITV